MDACTLIRLMHVEWPSPAAPPLHLVLRGVSPLRLPPQTTGSCLHASGGAVKSSSSGTQSWSARGGDTHTHTHTHSQTHPEREREREREREGERERERERERGREKHKERERERERERESVDN